MSEHYPDGAPGRSGSERYSTDDDIRGDRQPGYTDPWSRGQPDSVSPYTDLYGQPGAPDRNTDPYGQPGAGHPHTDAYGQPAEAGAWSGSYGQWTPAPPGSYPPGYGQSSGGHYQAPGYNQPYWYGYGPVQPVYAVQSTNGLAIASMILGILWLYWLGSILAVIFGHVSIKQIRENGQHGRGMAIAGLVLGYVGIGVLVVGALIGGLAAAFSA